MVTTYKYCDAIGMYLPLLIIIALRKIDTTMSTMSDKYNKCSDTGAYTATHSYSQYPSIYYHLLAII